MGDFYFQGSTKEIVSLIKTLPDKDRFNDALRSIVTANSAEERKKRRFTKHPRRMPEKATKKDKEPFIVLKKPSTAILTDSSDEYCDVTVRGEQNVSLFEGIGIPDHILANIDLEKLVDKTIKNEKDRENSEKRSVKKEVAVEGDNKPKESLKEAPKEAPKLYIDRKLRGVIDKSVQVLEDIENALTFGLDPPDGSEDFERRRKRAMEFSTRFSRIHLYQLNRHVTDLQEIMKPSSGRLSNRPNVFTINQKFHTANQSVYQGLQAYNKHLSMSIVMGVPEKLREFLKSATSLCSLYKEYSEKHPTEQEVDNSHLLIENLDSKCKLVSDKVVDSMSRPRSMYLNASGSIASLRNSRRASSNKSKTSRSKKLSMYHSVPIRNDVYWKKAIASLSQKKFDVPSRYKTATFKHRPPPPPPPPPEEKLLFVPQKISTKSDEKRSCTTTNGCKCKPKKFINDIDKVSTLIEAQNAKDLTSSMKRTPPATAPTQSQVMWNLAQGFFSKISKGDQVMTQEEYECILDHFITMVNENKVVVDHDNVSDDESDSDNGMDRQTKLEVEAQGLLEQKLGTPIANMDFNEFVEKLIESINSDKKLQHDERNAAGEIGVQLHRKDKKQTISVSGPKNAQLICIKDDTSLNEPSEDERPEKDSKSRNHRKSSRLSAKAESQNELIYRERADGDFSKSISKLTRVHKHNLKQIEMLPKDTVIKIIEYKLQFHKQTKNNCMYKKSGNMSPFQLVERISDKLLDEVLISITRDIQVEDILQKIYAHEFK